MFQKKVFIKCPRCTSRLNPRYNIRGVGLCDKCGWAGSYHSQNYEDWIQFKVSTAIVLFGLLISYGIIRTATQDSHPVELSSRQEIADLTQNQALKRPRIALKKVDPRG